MHAAGTASTLILFLFLISFSYALLASNNPASDQGLRITTSSNSESNAGQSFIVVPHGQFIPQGIMRNSQPSILALQIPFVVEINKSIKADQLIRWQIDIKGKNFGGIDVLSKHQGNIKAANDMRIWTSTNLDSSVVDRHRLVFRPRPFDHQPEIYKKGRGRNGERRRYGGGTQNINEDKFNPRLSYQVTAHIISANSIEESFSGMIKMDNKDMIRQEYINHYSIKRYGRGDQGSIPVPYREEISDIPSQHKNYLGNPLSESQYGLLINDSMSSLIDLVSTAYEQQRNFHKNVDPLKDLNDKILSIPNNKLWLSGGWRNPERNEWYSNALNSIHQRGGAVDIIAYEPPGHINAAVTYWLLWKALNNKQYGFDGFFQLETNGRPMRTEEFTDDIEPVNGIPDAFDKADHLHINIKYE